MKSRHVPLLAAIMLLASGCMTVNLEESTFIYPNNPVTLGQVAASDYQPQSQAWIADHLPEGYVFKEYWLPREDGTSAYGISAIHPDNPVTILYYGGNMVDLPTHGEGILRFFAGLGSNVIAFDHRGYGYDTGFPTVAQLQQDALVNYDFLRAQVDGKLVLYGFSLGSFEAGYVAEHRQVDGLILAGSATNIDEWSSALVPWYAAPFVRFAVADGLYRVDNLKVVETQSAPLLVLSAENDEIMPPELSKTLFAQAVAPVKRFHSFAETDHNSLWSHPDFSVVYREFIEQIPNSGE